MSQWGKGKHWLPSNDSNDKEQLAMEKELTAFARRYFSTDFPNPARLDCPAQATLQALVDARVLPDEALRTHLLGCSECFNDYQTALKQRQVAGTNPQHGWQPWREKLSAVFSLKPALVLASLVLFSAVGFWAWISRPTNSAPMQAHSESRPSPLPELPPSPDRQTRPAVESVPAPSPPVPETQSPEKKLAPDYDRSLELLAVDLNNYASVRSSDTPSQSLQLPRTMLRLNLTLAEGSLAGRYTVTLLNTADQAVLRRTAKSRTGKQLLTSLALQDIKLGSYYLSVRYAGEAARVYPVRVIENAHTKIPSQHPQ
jgi:hypothetical protein